MTPPIVMLASPVDVTPATTGSFQDVDLDTYIAGLPSGLTGVLLRVENTSSDTAYYFDCRKKGSTDALEDYVDYMDDAVKYKTCHACGVDANKIFQLNLEDKTYLKVYVIGYFTAGVTFLTNMVNKSISATSTWTDVDCSASAPSAAALIFRLFNTGSTNRNAGLRKNGSTDARTNIVNSGGGAVAIVGCDSSQICEHYISNAEQDLYLIGYVTAGCTMLTDGTNISLSGAGSWTDLAAAPAGATHAIIEVITASTSYYNFGLRENGSSDESGYAEFLRHSWEIVKLDANRVAEAKIENTAVDMFLIGYFHEPVTSSWAGTWGG